MRKWSIWSIVLSWNRFNPRRAIRIQQLAHVRTFARSHELYFVRQPPHSSMRSGSFNPLFILIINYKCNKYKRQLKEFTESIVHPLVYKGTIILPKFRTTGATFSASSRARHPSTSCRTCFGISSNWPPIHFFKLTERNWGDPETILK